ncbi:molybdopterin-dependent oxidoreductase [Nitratireductor pacificus]|nr:molybdopterin-dependent oxidoreductase [Nitratireductor pacificus]
MLKTGFCALCRSRCGARFEISEGRLVAAHPEPSHPTGSALCTKGRAAPEIVADPDRLLTPLRRTAPKGSSDPGWVPVGWDEALDDIAARLGAIRDRSGAEVVAFGVTTPSGTPMSDSIDWVERFIRGFGSPNTIYATELCNWHKDYAHAFTTGSGILFPDYRNTETILLWGFNPSAVWLDQATQIAEARARGAKIVAVDPRAAGYARGADHWLKLRPGSDLPLAMGLLRQLIARRGYDEAFLRRWTNAALLVRTDTGAFLRAGDIGEAAHAGAYVAWNGAPVFYDAARRRFDAGVEHLSLRGTVTVAGIACRPAFDHLCEAVEPYSPEHVARLTGVAPEAQDRAAELLSRTGSIAYYCWTGVGQHRNATQTDRAIALLTALKGRHDAPGGNVAFTKVPTNPVNGAEWLTPEFVSRAIGYDERPIGPPAMGWVRALDVYRAILDAQPYRVRGLVSFGANFAVSQAGADLAVEALRQLEFHVHCDRVMTPTAQFADYILPANTPWEREALRVGFEVSQEAESLVQLRQAALPSAGESRSDADIVFALAARLGMSDMFFGGDIDAARDWQLKPAGLSVAELRAKPEGITVPQSQRHRKYAEETEGGQRGFATDTGLVEIYSDLLRRHGQPPVPRMTGAPPEPSRDFPLLLTTAKSPYYCHSQYRSIPSLRKRAPQPQVRLHPDAAALYGLEHGETVRLRTETGEVRMQLACDRTLDPGTAVADYGFWQANPRLKLPGYDPFSDKGANFNRLIALDEADPVSGVLPHRSTRCAVLPLDEGALAWRGFRAARVVEHQPVAGDCMRVGFAVEGHETLPDYAPGQHIVLRISAPDGAAPVTRCYSLVGSARDANRGSYIITVRRVGVPAGRSDLPPGRASTLVHDGLQVGSMVELQAPKGRFTLPLEPERPVVMVAGGIGITPFLCYLETLAASGSPARVHLVYANRNGRSHAYRERLEALGEALPGMSLVSLYDAPDEGDRPGRDFDRAGRIALTDILPADLTEAPEVYHCGPPLMMRAVEAMLEEAGHPAELIHSESFGAPALPQPGKLPEGPFIVEFRRSGRTLTWSRDSGTLLDFAEKAGLEMASGCRAGQCESCAVRIIQGKTQPLSGDLPSNPELCLTCSTVPASDLILDG